MWVDDERKLLLVILILAAIFGALLLIGGNVARAEDGTIAYVAVDAGSALNVRDAAWGQKLGKLYRGDAVTVIGTQDDWSHVLVSLEVNEGWVQSCYLAYTPPCDEPEPVTYINASGGRARVRWLEAGESVAVTGWTTDTDGQRWAQVGDGYIAAGVLEASEQWNGM